MFFFFFFQGEILQRKLWAVLGAASKEEIEAPKLRKNGDQGGGIAIKANDKIILIFNNTFFLQLF